MIFTSTANLMEFTNHKNQITNNTQWLKKQITNRMIYLLDPVGWFVVWCLLFGI